MIAKSSLFGRKFDLNLSLVVAYIGDGYNEVSLIAYLLVDLSLVSILLHLLYLSFLSYETSPLQRKHNSMQLIRQLCILGFH